MVGKNLKKLLMPLSLMLALSLAALGMLSVKDNKIAPAGAHRGLQDDFAVSTNWTASGTNLESNGSSAVYISGGQARYNTPLPFGQANVQRVVIEFSVTTLNDWTCIALLPGDNMITSAQGYGTPPSAGLYFMVGAETKTQNRAICSPVSPSSSAYYAGHCVPSSFTGDHRLELVRNNENTLAKVSFDGSPFDQWTCDWSNLVNNDGNMFLNIDDTMGDQIVIKGVYVVYDYQKNIVANDGSDPANWTWSEATPNIASNGSDAVFITGGQAVYNTPIYFGKGITSVKVRFRVTTFNDWACVGFRPAAQNLSAGQEFWPAINGIFCVIGAENKTLTRVFTYPDSPSTAAAYLCDYPSPAAGTYTIEIIKQDNNLVKFSLNGQVHGNQTAAWSNFVDASNNLYLVVDDNNSDQVVIESIAVNDFLPPALTVTGVPTEGRTGEAITLPAGTVTDNFDKNLAAKITVTDPSSGNVTLDNLSFIPENAGTYTVTYAASDFSGNSAKTLTFTIEVATGDTMPVLSVDEWTVAAEVKINGQLTFPDASATFQESSVAVVVKVTKPDGTVETLAGKTFTPLVPGKYTVNYSATNTLNNTAEKNFTFFAKSDVDPLQSVSPGNLFDAANWLPADINMSGGSAAVTSNAVYLLPLKLTERIKFNFTVSGSGGFAAFALIKKPVLVTDFTNVGSSTAHANDGLYFMLSSGAYNITQTKGGVFKYLGDKSSGLVMPFNGNHAVEILKLSSGGISVRLDGQANPSGELANVDTSMFKDGWGETYLAIGVSGGVTLTFDNLTYAADYNAPVISEQSDLEGLVGTPVTVPLLTAEDDTDGAVPVTYVVEDPYGRTVTVTGGAFVLEYENEYRIVYTARDTSGNAETKTVTVTPRANPDLPNFWTTGTAPANGRVGVALNLPQPNITNGTVEMKVTVPSGESTVISEPAFTPSQIGVYTVDYTASNANGYSKYTLFINVKINADIDTTKDMDVFGNLDNWVQKNPDTVTKTDAGVTLIDAAYYKFPFDMTVGIEIIFTLDKLEAGTWMALSLTQRAGHGDFISQTIPGIYFMFYKDGNVVKYNCGTYTEYNNWVYSGNGTVGTYEDGMQVDLKLYRYNEGNPLYYNSVTLVVNGAKNTQFDMYGIAYTDIVDNEHFTYLSVGQYGAGSADKAQMTITGLLDIDITAPVITPPTLPSEAKVGDVIDLSGLVVTDDKDPSPSVEIRIQTPSGSIILGSMLTGNKLTLEEEGEYTVTVIVKDESGNSDFWVKKITVTEKSPSGTQEPGGQGCSCGAGLTGFGEPVIVLIAALLIFLIIKRTSKEK